MCPGLMDMWGRNAVEVRYVSGFEGHVGRWGKRLDEGWVDFGGIVAGLL